MDLGLIGLVLFLAGAIGMVLSFPIAVLMTNITSAWRARKEKRQNEIKQGLRTETGEKIKVDNPYLQRYYAALNKGDMDEMQAALIQCKEHCSGANSWCLTEMFCPDCPMGGLTVRSARAGL